MAGDGWRKTRIAKDTSARSNTKHDFTTTIVADVEQVVGDGDEADRRKVFQAIQVLDVTCLETIHRTNNKYLLGFIFVEPNNRIKTWNSIRLDYICRIHDKRKGIWGFEHLRFGFNY